MKQQTQVRITVWKDRPGRTRVIALLPNSKHEDASRYYYKLYHPNEDIKGKRILQLDRDPFNFKEDNLVAVTVQIMNCLLNNKLLSESVQLNKAAIKTIELELELKKGVSHDHIKSAIRIQRDNI